MFSFNQRMSMISETLKWFEPNLIEDDAVTITDVAMKLPTPSHVSDAIDFYAHAHQDWKLWLYLTEESTKWINISGIASKCPRGIFMNRGKENSFDEVRMLSNIGFTSLVLVQFQDASDITNSILIRREIERRNVDFLDQAPICPFVRKIVKGRALS